MDSSIKLGNMKVGKLLFVMSVPAIFSMLIQALYNIVDSIFVAKIDENNNALNALGLVFPLQMLIIAFALGVGVGTNSLISRRIGEKRNDEANQVANTGLVLAFICYLIFILIGIFISKPFMKLMSDNEEIINYGTSYLMIICIGSFGLFIEICLNKILQSVGNMKVPMFSQLAGAITNIILDPIFIFVFKMDVVGAAIATIIGQHVAMGVTICAFIFKKQVIKIKLRSFIFKSKIVWDILKIGIPTMIMNAISSITISILNTIIKTTAGDNTQAAQTILGVYFKLQSFIFMPIFGLMQGGMPILGYNYGSNNKKRYLKTLKLMLISTFVIMIIGTIIFQLWPHYLLLLFSPTTAEAEIGAIAFRKISLCFIPAAFGITFSTVFQSLGHGLKSLLMSLLRQIIVLLPMAYILAKFLSYQDMWYSYGIAEIITAIISSIVCIITIKNVFIKKDLQLNLSQNLS